MPNLAMTLISTTTVGAGGAASIDFTSIAASWTDLYMVLSVRTSGATIGGSTLIRFNGSSANLSYRLLQGNGASAATYTATDGETGFTSAASSTSNTFANNSIYIPNYAGSTNKSFSADTVTENNATTAYQGIYAGLWSNTAAITSISLVPASGTFVQYSTASLYGILKGSGGATVA
jgi:hypothetical protein